MKFSIRLILFILFATIPLYNFASHLLGADLTYECLGPGQYRVTLSLYRDCNGITPSSSQTLTYSSAICGANGSITLSSIGPPSDITPNCPSVPSACGGNGNYGIQEWIYQGILNLPPGCGNDWVLGWSQCCRNAAINTLNGPDSQDMYVGALLDNTTAPTCNSSPEFNNAPGSIVCVNQPVIYNHGVTDADGDSLYFTLGSCYEAYNNQVNYNGGYNATTPLSTSGGISVNPTTGAISFTPNQQQVGVLCIHVDEFRNGVKIGEINRDMQFTVIACSNVPPQASGVNGAPNTNPVNFQTSICINSQLCFDINGTDPNGNNVTMSWNNEIPAGTFTVANNGTPTPIGTFCWTPSQLNLGQNVFSVNVEDDACPIIGQGTYTYIVDVLPSPNILDAGPNDTICLGGSSVLTATSSPPALSYTWTPAQGLSATTGATVTATPSSTITYLVSASFPDGCDLTDAVTIGIAPNPQVSATPQNSFNCAGQITTLTASSNSSSTTFMWSPGGISGASIDVSPSSTTTYTVTATDIRGCQNSTTTTVNIAAPTGNVCNVLYVTPTGSPNGIGSKNDPMDLLTALETGACNGTIIKMAIGDYVTDTMINRVTSYLTLEGGFDPSLNWDKISTAGATRILRTATQSYSLVSTSIVSGSGVTNENGPNPEVVAIGIAGQTGFRFQDLTIECQLNTPGTTMSGFEGIDVIGVRLDGCSDYNVVRTRIIADDASNGANQNWSIAPTNGGSSIGAQILSNGTLGNFIQSYVTAGAAGTGGIGIAFPSGSPPIAAMPNGSNGVSQNVSVTGSALATTNYSFNTLLTQPTIRMNDIACTATNIDFNQASSGNWTFGSGSSPASATGATVSSMYNTLGRKNIAYGANTYTGFGNIILDSQVLPAFTTTAPFVQGAYRICAGQSVSFNATNGGVGYQYHWDLGGGATPNNYDGANYESLANIDFPTAGIYTIELQFETNCCGLSIPTTLELHVEEYPQLTISPLVGDICSNDPTPITFVANAGVPGATINWSPPLGLDDPNAFTVNALPPDSITYSVTVLDSSGLCADFEIVTVNVVSLNLSVSTVNAACGPNGSATVSISGGSGSYDIQWNDPANQTNPTATNLAVGNYMVTVTDLIVGCSDSTLAVVNPSPGSLVGYISNTVPVSCVGNGDGSLTVSIYGGAPPYDYVWSPTGGSINNSANTSFTTALLDGGTYTATITDNNGCNYTVSGLIPEPDSIHTAIDSLFNPSCLGATNGYVRLLADGGNAPLSIVWDDALMQTGNILSNVGVGTYCATIIDDNGCSDSVCITLIASSLVDTIYDTICQGVIYTFPSGIAVSPMSDTTSLDSLVNTIGCDSIVMTYLTVHPTYLSNISTTLCIGQSYTSPSGVVLQPVVDTLFNDSLQTQFGCDSVYVISIQVDDTVLISIDTTICQGSSFMLNGVMYNQTGVYFDTLNYAASGCDSVRYILNLQVDSVVQISVSDTICQGDVFTFNGVNYAQSGVYYDTLRYAASNCDSIQYTINLLRLDFITDTITQTICNGDSYSFNGINYTQEGTYFDTLQYANYPCDSVHYVIILSVDSAVSLNGNAVICQGDTFTFNGVDYTIAGNYSDTLYHASGCDSLWYQFTLQVNPLPIVSANVMPDTIVCANESITLSGSGASTYVWTGGAQNGVPFNPVVGTTVFIVEGTDINGCKDSDSISITSLATSQTALTFTICEDEFHTLPDGSVINTAGTYNTTLTSVNGCDSIVTTSLLVNQIGTFNLLNDVIVCSGLSQTFTISTQNMVSFEWFVNEGSGNQSLIGNVNYIGANTNELSFNLDTSLNQNIYSVQMIDECGNPFSTDMILEVYAPHPVVNPVADTTFCLHEISVVSVDYNGHDYEWNNGELGSTVLPDYSGDYIVNFVENYTNCLMSDTINIQLEDCIANCVVLAPTGFSPNSSGDNDIFRVVTTCEEGFSYFIFNVYNRWGELIYSTNDWREGWDGTYKGRNAEIGTYTFYVEYTKELTNKKESLSGNVTLIR